MPKAFFGDNAAIAESLLKHSINTITVPNAPGFRSSLKNHADIQLCQIEDHCFIHPLFDSITADEISNCSKIVKCTKPISEIYPYDASYNACYTGKYLIHNLKFTAPEIIDFCKIRNIPSLHINQGYARCSILPVNAEAVITADSKSAEILKQSGIDVLLIQSGFIKLEGFKYGFLGGCCGIYKDKIYITGNFNNHPDKEKILSFIDKYAMKAQFLSEELIDIGSIFFLNQL
ncbi:MAG TPA: hypothetical protein PLA54_11005 [Spirochaetota bacterium]|nr:hypothetical protein [Spirochaetota bacterium]HQE59706.1 hypothetical protein [Spirochaetota bacterium]